VRITGQSHIEAFTRKVASRYVAGPLSDLDRGTANRKLSAPLSYWVKRGHVEANPWHNQAFAKVRKGATTQDARRPLTDSEVAILIAGDADQELADLMRVAALSGMRIDEPYRIHVADCADGWFTLRRAKTAAGRRRIPIHSALVEIVARRTKGESASAFLFHEAGPERAGRERSMAASKRFGHYRKRLGVDETRDGARQSAVVFASFRNWFITKARAGFDRAVVAAIVGHEAGNITDDVYSGGPPDALRRACVESVKLPVAASPNDSL
jgi:integrase